MPKLIEYIEVKLNEQLGPIAHMYGVADKECVTSTHHWLSDTSVWSLLASEYFGLPFPNLAVAIRIAKATKEAAPRAPVLLMSADHGMLIQAIQTPRPSAGVQQPPAQLYQQCSKIFQAILDAKETE